MSQYLDAFRDNLRTAINSQRIISKTDLHKQTGISLQMIYRYLYEDAEPGLLTLELIAKALGTTPQDLITKKEQLNV